MFHIDYCNSGEPIPRIQYTPEEVYVWGTALSKLKALFPTHACKEFNQSLPAFNFRWALQLHAAVCSRCCCSCCITA